MLLNKHRMREHQRRETSSGNDDGLCAKFNGNPAHHAVHHRGGTQYQPRLHAFHRVAPDRGRRRCEFHAHQTRGTLREGIEAAVHTGSNDATDELSIC